MCGGVLSGGQISIDRWTHRGEPCFPYLCSGRCIFLPVDQKTEGKLARAGLCRLLAECDMPEAFNLRVAGSL